MKKFLLVLSSLFMATAGHAMNATRADIVGDWICRGKHESITANTLLRYYADGTADEFAEIIDKDVRLPTLELQTNRYAWQLKGDKLYMSDMQMPFYELYDFTENGLVKVNETDTDTELYRQEILESYAQNNWHYIAFDDKDHHRYHFEDGFGGECRRLK